MGKDWKSEKNEKHKYRGSENKRRIYRKHVCMIESKHVFIWKDRK